MAHNAVWVTLLLAAVSVAIVKPAAADLSIKTETYEGWQDACRISNGTVDLVVVPSVARIMRYGYVGGENVLWNNGNLLGKPVEIGKWPNHGGDKIWPWPQGEWSKRTSRGWPPPPATDQVPHQLSATGPGSVRLVSPLLVGYGVRIVRDIELAPTGTRVTIRSRMEKIRDGADFPVGVWAITQMQIPDLMMARLLPNSAAPGGWKMLGTEPWKAITPIGSDMLQLERPPTTATKIGIDADLLAWVRGGILYTQKLTPATPGSGDYQPAERAQIYTLNAGNDLIPKDVPPYIELEMTSPTKVISKGDSQSLEITWELQRLPENARSTDAVAALLRAK